ncbi:MAG: hypothetical protein WKF75_00900 [Singulisphaera sp.]
MGRAAFTREALTGRLAAVLDDLVGRDGAAAAGRCEIDLELGERTPCR